MTAWGWGTAVPAFTQIGTVDEGVSVSVGMELLVGDGVAVDVRVMIGLSVAVGTDVGVKVGKGIKVSVGGTAVAITITTSLVGTDVLSALLQASNNMINEKTGNILWIIA